MPNIPDLVEKIKPYYWFFFTLVLASILFFLGRLSVLSGRHEPIRVTSSGSFVQTTSVSEKPTSQPTSQIANEATISSVPTTSNTSSGEVIGSKSGKKYYFPWCGTVKRIKPENQVHFTSTEAARSAGFTPGGNCKGLK